MASNEKIESRLGQLLEALKPASNTAKSIRTHLDNAIQSLHNARAQQDPVEQNIAQEDAPHIKQTVAAWRKITESFSAVFHHLNNLAKQHQAENDSANEQTTLTSLDAVEKAAVAAYQSTVAFELEKQNKSKISNDTTSANASGTTNPSVPSAEMNQKENRAQKSDEKEDKPTTRSAKKRAFTDFEEPTEEANEATVQLRSTKRLKKAMREGAPPKIPTTPSVAKRTAEPAYHGPWKRQKRDSDVSVDSAFDAMDIDSTRESTPYNPTVTFEDVTAEAEARLQARLKAHAAKKGEMKRKRRSTGSNSSQQESIRRSRRVSDEIAQKRVKQDPWQLLPKMPKSNRTSINKSSRKKK